MPSIDKNIIEYLGESISDARSVGGGCIANARIITTASGKHYFLKSLDGNEGMFQKEANGLKELSKANEIAVPLVILVGDNFLLLECIEQGERKNNFFELFGHSLARLHRFTNDSFGFFEDNFIGASPQYNLAKGEELSDWDSFYFNKRLLPQLHMAEKQGLSSKELTQGIISLESKLPSILSGSQEEPSLLHGDLWGGNYMCDLQGEAVLIDPAVYYGHREADLAMTKMFGGFSPAFYDAYQSEYPLKEGWEYRENLYLLYHYLNHLNLFGSGYYSQSMALINFYIK